MKTVNFLKMQGLGNDFVVLDGRETPFENVPELARKLADRHFGIGCDQVIVLEKSPSGADVFMRIYNPDGSQAGACGNAARCIAGLVMSESGADTAMVETITRCLPCTLAAGGKITVDMGEPKLGWQDIPLAHEVDTLHLAIAQGAVSDPVAVNMGNPHAVFFVKNVNHIPLETVGPLFEHHPLFPQRANIEFVQVIDPQTVRVRVWERGTGITLACGSGACAVAVAAIRRGLISGREVTVKMDGGDLHLKWDENTNRVYMTGAYGFVFSGEFRAVA
jgi:diaminopimelate epimerase